MKRLAITSLLGFALLFSQGGVVLVAALCPHLSFSAPSCDMPTMESPVDHSQMAHHDMDHGSPAVANAQGHESCSHCVIHSRPNSNGLLVRTSDTVKRSTDLELPVEVSLPPPITAVAVAVLTPRQHGPPGKASRPKHVLISTFRI